MASPQIVDVYQLYGGGKEGSREGGNMPAGGQGVIGSKELKGVLNISITDLHPFFQVLQCHFEDLVFEYSTCK